MRAKRSIPPFFSGAMACFDLLAMKANKEHHDEQRKTP
jgi:hypothetical protein